MKYEGFYNKAWEFTKKVLKRKRFYNLAWTVLITAVVVVIVFIVARYSQTVWCFFITILNEKSLIQSDQPLQLAIGLLTVLVTIIAIVVGAVTWLTRREWEAFRKEQEPIIEKLQEDQDELMWISKLKDKVLPRDFYLRTNESKEVVESIGQHYNKDQDDGAWKMYGVGRYFHREHKYDRAIESYEEARGKYPTDEGLKLHIYQSLGLDYFLKGKELVKAGDTENAIINFEPAIKNYDLAIVENPQSVEALDNKGNTYIELAKISSGNKKEQLNEAIKCFNDAIQVKDKRDRQWWATCHFDKARALALRAGLALRAAEDKRKDLDEVVEELNKAINAVVKEPVGFDDPDVFQDFEDIKQQENEINRLLERLREVILQAG